MFDCKGNMDAWNVSTVEHIAISITSCLGGNVLYE
jgi:hypothetical protein